MRTPAFVGKLSDFWSFVVRNLSDLFDFCGAENCQIVWTFDFCGAQRSTTRPAKSKQLVEEKDSFAKEFLIKVFGVRRVIVVRSWIRIAVCHFSTAVNLDGAALYF